MTKSRPRPVRPGLAEKYLQRYRHKLYLPLDVEKVSPEFDFEGDDHPCIVLRALTVAEVEDLGSDDMGRLAAALASITLDFEGDHSLSTAWREAPSALPTDPADVAQLYQDNLLISALQSLATFAEEAALPSASEAK